MTPRMRQAVTAMLLATGALMGCTRPSDPHRMPRLDYLETLPVEFDDPEAGVAMAAASMAPDAAEWWVAAGDPVLDQLLARADSANNSIAVAAARLAQAEAAKEALP